MDIIIICFFFLSQRDPFTAKKNEELFHFDTSGKKRKVIKRQKKPIDAPLKCLSSLQSTSAVPPFAKR